MEYYITYTIQLLNFCTLLSQLDIDLEFKVSPHHPMDVFKSLVIIDSRLLHLVKRGQLCNERKTFITYCFLLQATYETHIPPNIDVSM